MIPPESVGVVVIDPAGRISVADGAEAIGVTPEAQGHDWRFALAERPTIRDSAARAIAGRPQVHVVEVDGHQVEVRSRPRGDGGATLVVVEPPTFEIAALEARTVEAVLRLVPGALWATDRDLRVVYARGRVVALSDIDPGSVPGQTIDEFLGTDDPADVGVESHRAALAGERRSFAYQFRGRSFDARVEPLHDDSGEVLGCVGVAIDVTERRLQEEELERSRRRYEEAQRVAHVGSFEWDVERDTVTWSDEMHRIYGLEVGTFGGTLDAFLERVHEEDLTETKGVILDALRRSAPFAYDHRVVRTDGTVRMLHTRGQVIPGARDRSKRVVGSCWDVTDLREATDRLSFTASLLRATIEATADGLLVVDREGKVSAYNERFLQMWNIPRDLAESGDDEALLAHVADQLQDPQIFLSGVQALYGRPETESFDVLRFKDGRVYERLSRPQRLDDSIAGRVWSFRDVTEREHVLNRVTFLSDASRLLTSLDAEAALESVAHIALSYLAHGCAIDLLGNGGPRRLLAVSRDASRPIAAELKPQVLAGHSATYDVGGISYLAVPLTGRNAVLGAITLAAPPGRRYGENDLAAAQELARRASLSLQNASLYRATREALEARDLFLGVAAHELRGPLTSMGLALQNLRDPTLAPEQHSRMFDVLERGRQRLARFVEELLDAGRMRGGMQFAFENVDVADVIRSAVATVQTDLSRSGSSLSVTTAGRTTGRWDRFRLEQVVTNLLANAIKFGLGRPIELIARSDGRYLVISVRDQGIGIPSERRDAIFEPFERAVSARHYGGLGLGLYIIRKVVTGLGGSVDVESEPGKGSTFTVKLPHEQAVDDRR